MRVKPTLTRQLRAAKARGSSRTSNIHRHMTGMPGATLKRCGTAEKDISPPPRSKRRQVAATTSTPATTPAEAGGVKPAADVVKKVTSTTNSNVIKNFFAKPSEKQPERSTWRSVGNSLFICKYDKPDAFSDVHPRRIALFDFDSTLIVTNSGKKFGREAGDWKWWHASVEAKLHGLVSEGYLVCIVSNQAGLKVPDAKSKAPTGALTKKVTEWKGKVKAVLDTLDEPITLYAARDYDQYRKPRVGMWEQLLADHDLKAEDVDMAGSIFVGDAAGRLESQGRAKDFSCSDRDFAANIGIPFYTPEEYFLGQEARPFARVFEPRTYMAGAKQASPAYERRNPQDVVLFVGSPGAGKSSFFWRHLEPLGYKRVNQDLLGTRDKCLQAATEALQASHPVVVDNTNADPDVRAHWIRLAAQHGLPIRCVHFTAPPRLCEHNDAVRALAAAAAAGEPARNNNNPEGRKMLPRVAFSSFGARFVEPNVREGFQDVVKVEFRFEGGEEDGRVWGRYWM